MSPALLSLIASLVSVFRGINAAHPEILQAATRHLPFHNGLQHVLTVDLPAVVGSELAAHVHPDVADHPADPANPAGVTQAPPAAVTLPSVATMADAVLDEIARREQAAKAA